MTGERICAIAALNGDNDSEYSTNNEPAICAQYSSFPCVARLRCGGRAPRARCWPLLSGHSCPKPLATPQRSVGASCSPRAARANSLDAAAGECGCGAERRRRAAEAPGFGEQSTGPRARSASVRLWGARSRAAREAAGEGGCGHLGGGGKASGEAPFSLPQCLLR